jgi:hypothetical protein
MYFRKYILEVSRFATGYFNKFTLEFRIGGKNRIGLLYSKFIQNFKGHASPMSLFSLSEIIKKLQVIL